MRRIRNKMEDWDKILRIEGLENDIKILYSKYSKLEKEMDTTRQWISEKITQNISSNKRDKNFKKEIVNIINDRLGWLTNSYPGELSKLLTDILKAFKKRESERK